MDWTPGLIEYIVIFLFGSVIGSFLNVVIYRVPAELSLISPPSHCPHCDRPIKAYENIPIFSYLFLMGKCAGCKAKISIQYPLIEAIMGGMLVLLLFYFNWSWDLLIYGVLAALLLSLSVIDFFTYRLPNAITLTGSILALILTVLFRRDFVGPMFFGALTGLGTLFLMGLLGKLIFRKNSLGLGDVKLAGMIGLFLGPAFTLGMFFLGSFLGAIFGIGMIITGNGRFSQRIPFGPYLSAGALISLIWGKDLWQWYWKIIHF